ncbi:MAG TPA: hypothetical protein VG406_21600 [Isosphaeraceae bacterium]|jgi:peptidyl-prolyl cis-trans isomerase D|nr:hypothetical protein [Isosphaeraceae bacterium]
MPFAVFRRHQKKLLAIFALLAMFGFVVGGTLPQLLSGRNPGGGDTEVVKLYGKPVYRSEIAQMKSERALANQFLTALMHRRLAFFMGDFGPLDTRSMVDALILRHEAEALGIPANIALARDWLKELTGGELDDRAFNQILEEDFRDGVGGERLLTTLADQLRINKVLDIYGGTEALVTPLDLFEAYRDERETVSAKLVPVRVAEFLKDKAVGEPTDADVRALFDKYKDVLPDPDRPTPGFKAPRRVRLEIVWIDGAELAETYRKSLTEKELRAEFADRQKDPVLAADLRKRVREYGDLPIDLFAGDPEAKRTPVTFARAREILARDLAEKKTRETIAAKFNQLSENVMGPYERAYDDWAHPPEAEDGKAAKPQGSPPTAPNLEAAARKLGLQYEKTPPLTREQAAEYGQIHLARAGLNNSATDPLAASTQSFVQGVFDAKRPLFEALDFSDDRGRRYLVWKVADVAEHVPTLDEARPDVVGAWKLARARVPARAAADAIRKKAEAAKGELTKETVGDRPILTTPELSRMTPSYPGGPSRPQEIPEVPHAGQAFRDAFFNLKPGAVVVEPDAPETAYYVIALAHRNPAAFATFIGPIGPIRELKPTIARAAQYRGARDALASLRARAGLPENWTPPDEADHRDAPDMPADED